MQLTAAFAAAILIHAASARLPLLPRQEPGQCEKDGKQGVLCGTDCAIDLESCCGGTVVCQDGEECSLEPTPTCEPPLPINPQPPSIIRPVEPPLPVDPQPPNMIRPGEPPLPPVDCPALTFEQLEHFCADISILCTIRNLSGGSICAVSAILCPGGVRPVEPPQGMPPIDIPMVQPATAE